MSTRSERRDLGEEAVAWQRETAAVGKRQIGTTHTYLKLGVTEMILPELITSESFQIGRVEANRVLGHATQTKRPEVVTPYHFSTNMEARVLSRTSTNFLARLILIQ
jgi:hypothetical protein